MNERYAYRLIRDLFAHKEAIFGELKRASSLSHTQSGAGQRPRAISSDESNRRANMEERARAIASRSRASSPAPSPRMSSHRRERSTGGPETRFPVNTSPVDRRTTGRNSLEVPGSAGNSPTVSDGLSSPSTATAPTTNGTSVPEEASTVEKRNSLGRSGGRFPRASGAPGGLARQSLVGNRDSISSLKDMSSGQTEAGAQDPPRGVELVDKPMDD